LVESKLPHPVDIYENENGLGLDIACTGIPKEDIEILIEGNTIKIHYNKPSIDDKEVEYLHKGIAKRSFHLGWKIDNKYDLPKASAEFINGLLKVTVPLAKGNETKKLKIK
tara:strand:- start:587 stop:919 length:333 start_codon:yes stop_codon:yes gene_type:complete